MNDSGTKFMLTCYAAFVLALLWFVIGAPGISEIAAWLMANWPAVSETLRAIGAMTVGG